MAKITAAEINDLRKRTGAGMMDCKKALTETDGDFEAAIDVLRKQGQKIAAKRGDREANEGFVLAKTTEDESRGVVLVLNCETDFVSKNEDFSKLANTIIDVAIANDAKTAEDLGKLSFDGNGLTVADKIIEQTGVIGEKLEISSFGVIEATKVVAYNHPGNRLATIVGLNKAGNFGEDAKQVAMQVAAMNPIAVDKDAIPQDIIDREIEVGKDQAIQEGKPAEMAEKIAMGRLNKFFKENTLLNQPFVRDNKKSVQQFLTEIEDGLTVQDFKRIQLA